MSMSTYVQAFRDMEGEFKKMLSIKKFCDEQKVSYPKEVTAFFGSSVGESEECLKEEMLQVPLDKVLRKYSDDGREGYEIDVKDIPKSVKTIRFVNSW
jgi:hypothetical protein